MDVKAVHIKLMEDMMTEAFIGTLKRFITRKGRPSDIYSNNSHNFVGAEQKLQQLFQSPKFEKKIYEAAVKEEIT